MLKKKTNWFTITTFLFLFILLSSCTVQGSNSNVEYIQSPTYSLENTIEPPKTGTPETKSTSETKEISFWIDPKIRNHPYFENLEFSNVSFVDNKEDSTFWLETQADKLGESRIIFEEIYVLTVPFINQTDNVKFDDLAKIWSENTQSQDLILWIEPEDEVELRMIFKSEPGERVISSVERPESCEIYNCWRVMNFSNTNPEWRIITIEGQSPLSPTFDVNNYLFAYRIYLSSSQTHENDNTFPITFDPKSNFDQSQLTSVLMTGTTALVRNTAFQIEQFGYEFPLKNLGELFNSVDIIHVSNEVPFYSLCPPAVPVRNEMRFCSDPGYIETLKLMGVDVVELTGNHLLDWGPEAFLETLTLYEENGIETYGGGRTHEDAEKPLVIEHNGNKIAFLGCNLPGPENNWVSYDRPGSLSCDLDELQNTIIELRERGINPIFTFQHNEFNTFRATQTMREDFWKMAKAGAVIVSGSQAHYPQGIDFLNSSFIHYGLGNFLFDQMYTYWGMATIDVHYFYNNQYINTHQYPIINENFGQPRLMNEEESALLFEKIYASSFYFQAENP